MEVNEIKNLEEKYFEKIWQIQTSHQFLDSLNSSYEDLKAEYDYIYENYDDNNIIKVAAERLIRYFGYSLLDPVDIYPSPLSSDMAIETSDAIICIDAKTINMITNAGDDKAIHFQRNQITFENKLKYGGSIGDIDYKGIGFSPNLSKTHNNKPILTFFITINYDDDHKISTNFKLQKQSLVSVPNFYVARESFDNDLITNYKTYTYINKVLALKYGSSYLPKNSKKDSWIEFVLHRGKCFFDPNLLNPEDESRNCMWKWIDNKYKIVRPNAGSARISKDVLKPLGRVKELDL
jgi:hypothetical protein